VVNLRLARQVLWQFALIATRLARLRVGRCGTAADRGSLRCFGGDERELRIELFAGAAVLLASAA
jgi:hypothetical protein